MYSIRYTSKEVSSRKIFSRLLPGTELIQGIKAICREHSVKTGIVTTLLGSLRQISYVYPIAEPKSKSRLKYCEPLTLQGPIEIFGADGTIGVMKDSEELAIHLHATFSDPSGTVYGGHILEEGNPTAVTIEVAIEAFDDLLLERALDDETDMSLFTLKDRACLQGR